MRTAIVAIVPSVHSEGDKGFVPRLIIIARTKGISAYIGDGSNRCPTAHRLDAAHLFRLALEAAPAEARLDGVGDEGVPFRDIATVIGHRLNLPIISIARAEAGAHFGALGAIAGLDVPRSSIQPRNSWDGGLVIPGTIRDSVYVLEALLEQESGLTPTEIMSDTASYSDLMFGLFGA